MLRQLETVLPLQSENCEGHVGKQANGHQYVAKTRQKIQLLDSRVHRGNAFILQIDKTDGGYFSSKGHAARLGKNLVVQI